MTGCRRPGRAGPRYRQNLLHCDPAERFSVVSFVWGPGQQTPMHDHPVGAWWAAAGEEISTEMPPRPAGTPTQPGRGDRLRSRRGGVVSADSYDIHVVENALPDRTSISIHCYGGNIGAVRADVFDPVTGETQKLPLRRHGHARYRICGTAARSWRPSRARRWRPAAAGKVVGVPRQAGYHPATSHLAGRPSP